MNKWILVPAAALLLAGCGGVATPTKTVTATAPAPVQTYEPTYAPTRDYSYNTTNETQTLLEAAWETFSAYDQTRICTAYVTDPDAAWVAFNSKANVVTRANFDIFFTKKCYNG